MIEKLFPCSEKMKNCLADNKKATDRLIKACQPKFPELKEKHIVSPR